MRQLNDNLELEDGSTQDYYKSIDEESLKDQYDQIKNVLKEGVQKNYLTKEFASLMLIRLKTF